MQRALLERNDELGQIAEAIANPGRVLVVEGDAGIGKSALLSAGAELAREAGARVLTAHGGLLERDFGHGITRQLFERQVWTARPSQRQRWLAGAAALAAPVLGVNVTSDAGSRDDPAFAAQHGLYWLTANIARDGPLFVVVDDLHWADLASFRWLVYLARRLEDLPVVVLAGWRVGEPQAPQDLLDALTAERLAPRPLSVGAVATLVGRQLDRECDPDTARACHQATHGNPLLVSQLAHAMQADAALPLDVARIHELGGRAVAPYVRTRLAGLSPRTADVAAAAAVLASEVAPRRLAALTGLALVDVLEACDRLVEARVLTGSERLEFAHPLVRSAIYDTLTPVRRAAAHRATADVLDAEGSADRAAVHLVLAERTGDQGVVARLMTAATWATTRGAVDETIVLLSRALEEPPATRAARYEVLTALAHAEWAARDERAVEHARTALQIADGPAEYEAATLLLAAVLSPAGRQQAAVDLLATTADELREAAPERAIRLDVQRLAWSLMLPNPQVGIVETARALAPQVSPDSSEARILDATVAFTGAVTGALPAAAAAEMALGVLADRLMLEDLRVTAPFHWPLAALGHCERLDEYSEWVERRRRHAVRSGSRIEPPILAVHRAWIAWLRGNLATAIEEAHQALEDTETYSFFVAFAVSPWVSALVEQGELDEAQQVLGRHTMANDVMLTWLLLVSRIKIALARGDICSARNQLSAAPSEPASLRELAALAVEVALASGSTDEARERARAMLIAAERFGAPGGIGIARRLLGLATGGAEGLELLRSAVESLQRSPRRLELARALVDYGGALRRRKHRAASREPLRRGLDLAQHCGANTLAQHAIDELRATGARPRRLLLTGVEALTPSELRVARLVAQGRSNPEVAQALFVTRSTVETHLQAAFRKLDINSREQLPAALAADLKAA